MENNDKNDILGAINTVSAHVDDIRDTINIMSTHMDERFDKVEGRLDNVEKDVAVLKADVGVLKADVGVLKADVGVLKSTMVDKDHFDLKLENAKADILIAVHKEDQKLQELVKVLREKQILTDPDVKRVLSMPPYPKLYI